MLKLIGMFDVLKLIGWFNLSMASCYALMAIHGDNFELNLKCCFSSIMVAGILFAKKNRKLSEDEIEVNYYKLVGADRKDNTITLKLPLGMRPTGMVIGEGFKVERCSRED